MKREMKFLAFTAIVCILAGGIPWALSKKKEAERQELMNRKPNAATQKFRKLVKGATEIRVYDHVSDYISAPEKQRLEYLRQQPKITFRENQLTDITRAMHFNSLSMKRYTGPEPGGPPRIFRVLAFYKTNIFLGSLCYEKYPGHSVAFTRLYGPNIWQGDGRLDAQSVDYLENKFISIR